MWHIYILECSDKSLYCGITTDLIRRLKEHNNKKGGSYTRSRLPVCLKYSEDCKTRSDALKRESQIKRWTHAKKCALIEKDFEKLKKL